MADEKNAGAAAAEDAAGATEPVVRVEGLQKSFGNNVVLRGIDLTVMPGQVVTIIGASGSGKSTLLRCINLLETPDAGHVWFHGLSLQRSWLSENRLTVSISAHNPFGGKYSRMKMHYVQGDYTGFSSNRWTQRMFSLSVSYRFGSLRANVKKTDKTIDNNDVVGGASVGGGQNQPSGGN